MRRLSSVFLPQTPHTPHNALFAALPNTPSTTRRLVRMSSASAARRHHHRHQSHKLVVIMGPTGCGKSKLSIDLISRFFPASEIINSDKIQVYRGLDITTNKIPLPERKNVRHHLLGEFDDAAAEFMPADFRSAASSVVSQIISRRKIPFLVGGSNSFNHALLAKKFNPEIDVFGESEQSAFCKEVRYNCCFLWIDVFQPILNQYLSKRVDDMLDSGMLDELSEYFQTPESSISKCGLNKAIGVPEFGRYFDRINKEEEDRKAAYEEAVRAIKENTCQLAKRQVGKILRLRDEAGWELKRVDATSSFRARMEAAPAAEGGRRGVAEIWEREVVEPSTKIVKEFLME